MANVSINFNNKEYLLSCENGQEDHLEELSLKLNEKFNNLKNNHNEINTTKRFSNHIETILQLLQNHFPTTAKLLPN